MFQRWPKRDPNKHFYADVVANHFKVLIAISAKVW